jgi:hypothetical protein
MTEAEQIMKRCQVGTRNYDEANNLHADCYRVIGKLLKTIAKLESQEPVTLLPDGSAFGVMSFPLPDDHWLYAPNEYRDGEYEPIDLPNPILTHALRNEVVAAVRYAVRGATMRGQDKDLDPDALVQNAVYALCGPYTTAQPKAEKQEPVAYYHPHKGFYWAKPTSISAPTTVDVEPLPFYTHPPQRTWVGLTDEEENEYNYLGPDMHWVIQEIAAKLKEKNT